MRVFVYYNLHRKLWSIRCEEKGHPMKGRVIAHSYRVLLTDVTPKVSQAGRSRVLRDRRKNVHAGLLGNLVSMGQDTAGVMTGLQITYNPYLYESFVFKCDVSEEYIGSEVAQLNGRSVICRGLTRHAEQSLDA